MKQTEPYQTEKDRVMFKITEDELRLLISHYSDELGVGADGDCDLILEMSNRLNDVAHALLDGFQKEDK